MQEFSLLDDGGEAGWGCIRIECRYASGRSPMLNTRLKRTIALSRRSDDRPRSSWPQPPAERGPRRVTKPQTLPRLDLIASIRSQIAAGTYDSAERIDSALDKLLAVHRLG